MTSCRRYYKEKFYACEMKNLKQEKYILKRKKKDRNMAHAYNYIRIPVFYFYSPKKNSNPGVVLKNMVE